MQIEKRTMNWLPRASAYDEAVAARARRKASNEEFISQQSALMTTISSTITNQATESASLAAEAAMARVTKTA